MSTYDNEKRAVERAEFVKSLETEKDVKGQLLTREAKDKQIELFDATSLALEENAKRSGVGLRIKTGMTRGKGSMVISWEEFDEESKPKTLQEFISATSSKEDDLLRYSIIGYNDEAYTAASDPIAEHVNPSWDKDTQLQFRLVVRNAAKALNQSIETVAAMFKPGVEKAFAAKQKA